MSDANCSRCNAPLIYVLDPSGQRVATDRDTGKLHYGCEYVFKGAAAGSGEVRNPLASPTPPAAASVPSAPPIRRAPDIDFAAELMAALEEAEAQEAEEQAEKKRELAARFQPDTDQKVEWTLRLVQNEDAICEQIMAQAKAMVAERRHRLGRLLWRVKPALDAWLEGKLKLEAHKKKPARSVKTFAGTIGLRAVPGGARIKEPALIAQWAEYESGDPERFGNYGYRVDGRRVLEHVKNTSELVPGVEMVEPREVLYVKRADGTHISLTELATPPALPQTPNSEEIAA